MTDMKAGLPKKITDEQFEEAAEHLNHMGYDTSASGLKKLIQNVRKHDGWEEDFPDHYAALRDAIKPSVEEKAIKYFGLTNNPVDAGYLLQDGRMLDFSGVRQGAWPGGGRALDHREISEFVDDLDPEGKSYGSTMSWCMYAFMERGNIRMSSTGIHFFVRPTPEQEEVILAHAKRAIKDSGAFMIDYGAVGDERQSARVSSLADVLTVIDKLSAGEKIDEESEFFI